jgi:GNAT superfamily N-acetyltransferase
LAPHLFGERPVAEALVAERRLAAVDAHASLGAASGDQAAVPAGDGRVVAFALFFHNFSTFLARPGLYLEDLYVQPAHRGLGIAGALMSRLAALAVERGCGRFEWSVLDWNRGAIAFYEGLGATVMPDWRICRVTGDALQALGERRAPPLAAALNPPSA